jgi:hypothetical protein
VSISWGLSANDFALKLFDPSGRSDGTSNYLNLPGLTGRREKVALRVPAAGTFHAETSHTGSLGTAQTVYGVTEITRIEYPDLLDLNTLSAGDLYQVHNSLISSLLLPEGRKFRPEYPVSRAELAEAILRGGLVPQYVAAEPMFTDVRNIYSRNSIESVQANPGGKLFVDASAGGRFYPYNSAAKLIAAVAFVKAAKLDSAAASAILPASVLDAASIPAQWRGHVAVALQKGFLSLDSGQRFNPNRAVTRLELAKAVNALIGR